MEKKEKDIFCKVSQKLYVWIEKKNPNTKTRDYLQLLEPGVDIREKKREFEVSKIRLCILIVLCGGLLSGVLWIKELQNARIGDNDFIRASYGEGSKSYTLRAYEEDGYVEIPVVLEEKEWTKKELEEKYPLFLEKLRVSMLGKNISLSQLCYDLELCTELEGYPYTIEWYTDGVYVNTEGHLLQEELSEAVDIQLIAKISYKDFYREESFCGRVYEKLEKTPFAEKLTAYIKNLEESGRETQELILPTEFDGKKIVWKKKVSHEAVVVLFCIPVLVLVFIYAKDRDLYQLVENRKEQMTYDYPEIVSKLALFIGAGMTVQNAWKRVVWEYQKNQNKKKRYAYEEMIIAVREMDNGLAAEKAFENFGRRCKQASYRKLATLLSQYLKKGGTSIGIQLQQESANAFEERKQQVRQLGEKAGTKLLAPMMLLLFMVMIVILVPAFINQF